MDWDKVVYNHKCGLTKGDIVLLKGDIHELNRYEITGFIDVNGSDDAILETIPQETFSRELVELLIKVKETEEEITKEYYKRHNYSEIYVVTIT